MDGGLFRTLINGLDEEARVRTVELIAESVANDLDTVGGHTARRVDYGTRRRRAGLTYRRDSAQLLQPSDAEIATQPPTNDTSAEAGGRE
jgi:hypothetical protein